MMEREKKKLVNQMSVTVTCAFSIFFFFSFKFRNEWTIAACFNAFYNALRCMCITGTADKCQPKTKKQRRKTTKTMNENFMGIVLI